MTKSAEEQLHELDELNQSTRTQIHQLETAIAQVDQYQLEVQQLRQQIVQVEQQLRQTMAPTYLPHDRDQAQHDQQVGGRCRVSGFIVYELTEQLTSTQSRIDGSGMNCLFVPCYGSTMTV